MTTFIEHDSGGVYVPNSSNFYENCKKSFDDVKDNMPKIRTGAALKIFIRPK